MNGEAQRSLERAADTVKYAGVLAPASTWRSRIAPKSPPEDATPATEPEPGGGAREPETGQRIRGRSRIPPAVVQDPPERFRGLAAPVRGEREHHPYRIVNSPGREGHADLDRPGLLAFRVDDQVQVESQIGEEAGGAS
jgi:hypothetical protein